MISKKGTEVVVKATEFQGIKMISTHIQCFCYMPKPVLQYLIYTSAAQPEDSNQVQTEVIYTLLRRLILISKALCY